MFLWGQRGLLVRIVGTLCIYIKVKWASSTPRACTLARDEVSAHVSWVRTRCAVRMFGDDEVSWPFWARRARPGGVWQGKGRCRTCRCRPKQVLHEGFQEGFGNGICHVNLARYHFQRDRLRQ